MVEVHVTKAGAAQRQIDAAIRMLFSGEDPLAVHTVAAAAHGIVADLAEHRGPLDDDDYSAALRAVFEQLTGKTPPVDVIRRELPNFRKQMRRIRNRPANFLKHADQDAEKSLDPNSLETDDLLLGVCTLYKRLKLDITPEMYAFATWHLAVHPHEDGDKIETAEGPVHELPRDAQLEFGDFLLALYREEPQ